jgi:hypothetical protein
MSTMDSKGEAKNWMKKPKLDENRIKIGFIYFYIHNVDECRNILLHCNILCSQLSFTTNMKKRTLPPYTKFLWRIVDCQMKMI